MIIGKNDKCCGCTACEKSCPRNAICMVENKKGFLEPEINEELCINCNICNNVCPLMNGRKDIVFEKQKYYAAKLKDEQLRSKSQSGGAFAAIAEYFLTEKEACVYGVSLDQNLNAAYTKITKISDLHKLKGSKYVQASLNDAYRSVENDLNAQRDVLFSGTPCHIDGLKRYLNKRKVNGKNLFTVDIICHGVPSPLIYSQYLKYISKQNNNKKIKEFNFRDKSFGWHGHTISIKLKTRKLISHNYVNMFYSHYTLRDSCYLCKYANLNRVGDITIGDCWGIERFYPDFDDNKGCSLVIINSKNGNIVWNNIINRFYTKNMEKEQIIQPNLQHPTERPEKTDLFWDDYNKYGFEYVIHRYCNYDSDNDYVVKSNPLMCFRRMFYE